MTHQHKDGTEPDNQPTHKSTALREEQRLWRQERAEVRCGAVVDPTGRGDEEGAAVRCACACSGSALEGENARTASVSFIRAATATVFISRKEATWGRAKIQAKTIQFDRRFLLL